MSGRRVAILGATGSIGRQALDVVRASRGSEDELEVVAVTAGSSWQALAQVVDEFDVPRAWLDDAEAREAFRQSGVRAECAPPGGLLDPDRVDLVLNAVVGFAGYGATLHALDAGLPVALANKETLVAGGPMLLDYARERVAHQHPFIPVDSEHSALLQCLGSSDPDEVESLVLTASGGPFRGRDRASLADVTVEQALAHPTWDMGGKISIDSATLMNKGLELIEAAVLFKLPAERIEIVVHPDSIVHAMVRHVDGALLSHLGLPDMRVPISYALHWPRRRPVDAPRLDLVGMPALHFLPPDVETFRCLALARAAASTGGAAPCVLNAANEVAVEAFLAGRLPFLGIDAVVEGTLEQLADHPSPRSVHEVPELDATARRAAGALLPSH